MSLSIMYKNKIGLQNRPIRSALVRDSKRYHQDSFEVILDLTTYLYSVFDAESQKVIFRS